MCFEGMLLTEMVCVESFFAFSSLKDIFEQLVKITVSSVQPQRNDAVCLWDCLYTTCFG